jgi:hypothetical protein
LPDRDARRRDAGQPTPPATVFMLRERQRDEPPSARRRPTCPDRSPNRHTTFGLGASLPRLDARRIELRIVLEQVFARLPDFRVDLGGVVEADTIGIVFGRRKVPIAFTPGKRLAEG